MGGMEWHVLVRSAFEFRVSERKGLYTGACTTTLKDGSVLHYRRTSPKKYEETQNARSNLVALLLIQMEPLFSAGSRNHSQLYTRAEGSLAAAAIERLRTRMLSISTATEKAIAK